MRQKILILKIVFFLFAMSVALNIWFFIENDNLKNGIDIYKDIVNDYSSGNIDIIESAIIDSIKTNKSIKHD